MPISSSYTDSTKINIFDNVVKTFHSITVMIIYYCGVDVLHNGSGCIHHTYLSNNNVVVFPWKPCFFSRYPNQSGY